MSNLKTRAAACIVAALFVTTCSPFKKVEKADQDITDLKAKWIGEWVIDHPCPSLPPVNLDSLCGVSDFAFNIVDTVKHDTTRMPCRTIYKRILVPYQDTRTVDLLYDSLRAKTERLAMLEGRQEGETQDCILEVDGIRKERNTWLWAFIGACVVVVILVVKDIYGFFKL
jgi:hypothetical protein